MKHSVILLAVLLMIVWVIAKVTIAVTSLALHLLWIAALILMVVWLIGRLRAG